MRVGVVGATGLVGTEMLLLLDQRNFPVDELRAYASPRSEGRALPFKDGEGHPRATPPGVHRRPVGR